MKFTSKNRKLAKLEQRLGVKVHAFSILSGFSCPYAMDCHSRAVETLEGIRILDGPLTKFRCFSASQEALLPTVYQHRKHNLELLKSFGTLGEMVDGIELALPKKAKCIRVHVGGDFFNQTYFDAWLAVSRNHPSILFYAYTKSLPFWVKRKWHIDRSKNFILTASYGGFRDKLIQEHKLRYAKVVFTEDEAAKLNLEIDDDDSHAALPELKRQSFALLIHGVQPAGSDASKAKVALMGKGSYGEAR